MREYFEGLINFVARALVPTAILFFSVSSPALAAEELNLDKDGYMLHGMDPVSYHLNGKATPGDSEIIAEYMGAKFRFANAENRSTFQRDPAKFMPAYGGWCSYGVRVGKKFDIDPDVFMVVDGKLYVQLDQGTQKVWIGDIEKNIAIADRIWPSIEKASRNSLGK